MSEQEERRRRAADLVSDEVRSFVHLEFMAHEAREQERYAGFEGRVMRAFPDGVDPHREYHQKKIDAAKEEAEYWKAAKIELARVGVSSIFGVLKIVAALALIGLAFKVGAGPLVVKLFGVTVDGS